MRFEDLKECPFCGCDTFITFQKVKGYAKYRARFDGEETDNEDMYDSLKYEDNGKARCNDCNSYLGNYISGEIGKSALKKMEQDGNRGE